MSDATSWAAGPPASETSTADGSASDPFDRLAEEFATRCRRGESPSIGEYEARYPDLAERIRELLPSVAMMEQLKRDIGQAWDAEEGCSHPKRLGEFHVVRELGRGGMGVVYEAAQESLGRHVALKVIHRHGLLDAKRLRRFRREAQAVAQLHHTNIVPIFGVGEHDGLPYYVMQHIRGSGLDVLLGQWRSDGPPRGVRHARFVARVGVQAAEALDYAHGQGVLHRDVKPANLLIDERETVWVTDFGLAKLTGQDDLTASGDVIGTLRYLAPEALRGETDGRGDVYSLGLTLYELLTLTPPFGALSPSELLRHVTEGRPTRPRKLDPTIPRDLETIILKATAREPEDRYPTAADLAADLKNFLDDRPIRARRANAGERLWRWGRRNRTTAALTATAAASLLLAAVVGWIGYASTTRALEGESRRRGEAERATRRAEENVALSLRAFEDLFGKLASRGPSLPPPPGPAVHRRHPHAPDAKPDRRAADRRPFQNLAGLPPARGFGPADRSPDDLPQHEAALLQSVLTFYDRFAARNATNPKLQGEAARAYRKVGALYQRLGRERESRAAYARAAETFEALVVQFPKSLEYRFELAETYAMDDPWTADEKTLGPMEDRLRRAATLAESVPAGAGDDFELTLVKTNIDAKLGAVLQRRHRPDDGEAYYRRAIALEASLVASPPLAQIARIDRAATSEALASLLLERGRRAEARTLLDSAAADLQTVAEKEPMHPFLARNLAGRFANLAGAFGKLGATDRAGEMAAAAVKIDALAPHRPLPPPEREVD